MRQASRVTKRAPRQPEPTWPIAHLFPLQGAWSEEEYLGLPTNHFVEFSDGFLEVLPIPTTSHQMLVAYLYGVLQAFTSGRDLGTVLMAPLPVRLWRGKLREPDVVFMSREHAGRIGEEFWMGADLVMEVVSGQREGRRCDLVTKRREYAHARIPEYWIVDPQKEQLTVLRLRGKRYIVHGKFGPGKVASSHLLPGFSVDVGTAFSHAASGTSGKGPAKSGPARS